MVASYESWGNNIACELTTMPKKEESRYQKLKRDHFPGLSFQPTINKVASKILDEKDCIAYLEGKGVPHSEFRNLSGYADATIVSTSVPIGEMLVSKVSEDIQKRVYSLTKEEFELGSPAKE